MFDLIPMLLVGAAAGGIIGWVAGHHAGVANGTPLELDEGDEGVGDDEVHDERKRLEEVARTIRSLTLTVAADVTAHQSKMADITSDLQDSGFYGDPDQIIAAVAELVAANLEMQAKLHESQDRIQEQAKQLHTTQQLANTDALTGLANRRALDQKFQEIRTRTVAGELQLFSLIDIDHFKSVNDRYGHPAGDVVLSRVAQLLEGRLGPNAFCARYGGEEFAVLCTAESVDSLASAINHIRHELSRMRLIAEDTERQITFSAGVCSRLDSESDADWVARVDQTLYAAKNCGRNSVFVYGDKGPIRYSDVSVAENSESRAVTTTAVVEESSPAAAFVEASAPITHTVAARQCLVSQMRTMANNIDLDHVSVAAVAIRLPQLDITSDQREVLLDRTRSLLRAVDKVGFDDPHTMLSIMVTANERKTVDRANEMLDEINATLRDLYQDANCDLSATVGVSLLDRDSSVEDVIRKATEQAGCPLLS